jgi:hypothetical protein
MPNAMQIDLRLGGVDAAVAGLERVAAAFDRVTKSQGGGGSSGGGTRIPVPSSDATKYLQGPNQRLQKIAEQLQQAVSEGNAAAEKDLRLLKSQAERTLDREAHRDDPKATRFLAGPNQRLARIAEQLNQAQAEGNKAAEADLRIAEFNAKRAKRLSEERMAKGDSGGGLLELFGDLNKLLGGLRSGNLGQTVRSLVHGIDILSPGGLNVQQKLANAVTGPGAGGGAAGALEKLGGVAAELSPELLLIGGAIISVHAAAIAGVKMLADETVAAARRLGQIGAAGSTSGGRSGDIFGLGAFGVAPNQVAGAAGGLRERLAADPFARMAGSQLGLDPQIPAILGGSQNNARVLREALTALRGVTDQEEQLRLARQLGLESMVDELRVSERVFQQRMRQAAAEEQLFGEGTPFIQHSRDLNAELDITGKAFEDLRNAFATPFIEDASLALRSFSTLLLPLGGVF